MGIARTVGVLGSLLSLLAAQQQKLEVQELEVSKVEVRRALVRRAQQEMEMEAGVFRLPELGCYDDVLDLPEGAQTWPNRLRSLLARTLTAGKSTVELLSNQMHDRVILVHATPEEVATVIGAFEQLKKELPLRVRLQCSLVTLPLSVAQAQKLQDGRVVAVDAETVGKLMREASRNKGTLCNLPEVTAGPLAPFVIQSPRKPDAKEAETLRLRGEMLPLDDREVAIAMHLVRGALPADKTREPEGALLQPVFRLQAGKCALATVVEGDTATVLVVRCVDVAAKAPPAPAGR